MERAEDAARDVARLIDAQACEQALLDAAARAGRGEMVAFVLACEQPDGAIGLLTYIGDTANVHTLTGGCMALVRRLQPETMPASPSTEAQSLPASRRQDPGAGNDAARPAPGVEPPKETRSDGFPYG